jgi:hypothetical protein
VRMAVLFGSSKLGLNVMAGSGSSACLGVRYG